MLPKVTGLSDDQPGESEGSVSHPEQGCMSANSHSRDIAREGPAWLTPIQTQTHMALPAEVASHVLSHPRRQCVQWTEH